MANKYSGHYSLNQWIQESVEGEAQSDKRLQACIHTHTHIPTHLIIFIFAPIKLSGNKYQMIP